MEESRGCMLPVLTPLWLVCEDGHEYYERFLRFLSGEFAFERVDHAKTLFCALETTQVSGVLLDLDFRRTPDDELIDEQGRTPTAVPQAEKQRLAESQGILILRELRRRGHATPVLLCADLEDPEQVRFLETTLAPLSVSPSHESIAQIADRLRVMGKGT